MHVCLSYQLPQLGCGALLCFSVWNPVHSFFSPYRLSSSTFWTTHPFFCHHQPAFQCPQQTLRGRYIVELEFHSLNSYYFHSHAEFHFSSLKLEIIKSHFKILTHGSNSFEFSWLVSSDCLFSEPLFLTYMTNQPSGLGRSWRGCTVYVLFVSGLYDSRHWSY